MYRLLLIRVAEILQGRKWKGGYAPSGWRVAQRPCRRRVKRQNDKNIIAALSLRSVICNNSLLARFGGPVGRTSRLRLSNTTETVFSHEALGEKSWETRLRIGIWHCSNEYEDVFFCPVVSFTKKEIAGRDYFLS